MDCPQARQVLHQLSHPESPKNTGAGGPSFLQGIFPTQGSNPGFSHCRQILYHLSHRGSPLKGQGLLNVVASNVRLSSKLVNTIYRARAAVIANWTTAKISGVHMFGGNHVLIQFTVIFDILVVSRLSIVWFPCMAIILLKGKCFIPNYNGTWMPFSSDFYMESGLR